MKSVLSVLILVGVVAACDSPRRHKGAPPVQPEADGGDEGGGDGQDGNEKVCVVPDEATIEEIVESGEAIETYAAILRAGDGIALLAAAREGRWRCN